MDILSIRTLLRTKSIYEIPLRVTFYARVSSESDEQLNSLDNQIAYYEDLIKKKEQIEHMFVYKDLEEKIISVMGTKVHINQKAKGKGKIEIEYYSDKELERIFVRNEEYNSLMITILSFGFKNGIPTDADLVFDVRFLPNPFYIDELKYKTGNNIEVSDYVMGFPEAGQFLEKLHDMMEFLIPGYIKEGKNQLVIAIGCTGGKHRSVTLANELYKKLKDKGNYGLRLSHRDEHHDR